MLFVGLPFVIILVVAKLIAAAGITSRAAAEE